MLLECWSRKECLRTFSKTRGMQLILLYIQKRRGRVFFLDKTVVQGIKVNQSRHYNELMYLLSYVSREKSEREMTFHMLCYLCFGL